MPREVGIRDLRDHLGAYMARVRDGESFVILDRGRPLAHLSPARTPEEAAVARLAREGFLSWGGGKPEGLANPPAVKDGTVADLVVRMRQ